MIQVALGFLFIVYFFSISIAAGLIAFYRYPCKDIESRLTVFFIGFGLGSYVISVYNSMFLIVFSHLPKLYFSFLHFIVFILSAVIIAKISPEFIKYTKNIVFFNSNASHLTKKTMLCSISLGFLIVFTFCMHYALQPFDNRDSLVYGTEVKIIAEERSYEARLSVDHPGLRNTYRGNDHPISFISYLTTAAFFQTSIQEDFPLRVAFQLPNVSLFICLCGFALRYGALAAALSSALFFTGIYFGTMMQIFARDSYYIIPTALLILCIEVFQKNKLVDFIILVFICWLFMWSSHSGALLFGALVALVQIILTKSNLDRAYLLAIIAFSFLIAGNHYIAAYHDTGSFLGNERTSAVIYKKTCPGGNVAPPISASTSEPHLGFGQYFNSIGSNVRTQILRDKPSAVLIVVVAIIIPLIMLACNKIVPISVFASSGFLAASWLLSIGIANFANPVISLRLMQNMRYRTIFIPIAAYAVGVGCAIIFKRKLSNNRTIKSVILVMTIILPLSTLFSWPINHFPVLLFRKDTIHFFENGGSWWPFFTTFKKIPPKQTDVILTNEDYFTWYYTNYNAISILQDKRLLPLASADSADEAKKFILDNNIKYFVFSSGFIQANQCSSLVKFASSFAEQVYAGEYYAIFYYPGENILPPEVIPPKTTGSEK